LLREVGLPVPKGIFIGGGSEIPPFHHLQFPLVAKVASSMIRSKSDINGVRLGLKSRKEVGDAVSQLMKIEHAEGVLIEEMAKPGREVIVGGIIDSQFGPVVMFGLGGVFVELFKDVAFGLAPLSRDGALWLIRQVKGYRVLGGYRGSPPVDWQSLVGITVAVSELMATGLIEEMDLNPVAIYPEGAMVLDAKMSIPSSFD